MWDQVQASDSEYRAQVQAPDSEYHAQVQLCAASYDADLSAPLNDAYHAEVVPHDRTPRTSQRRGPGKTYADVAEEVDAARVCDLKKRNGMLT